MEVKRLRTNRGSSHTAVRDDNVDVDVDVDTENDSRDIKLAARKAMQQVRDASDSGIGIDSGRPGSGPSYEEKEKTKAPPSDMWSSATKVLRKPKAFKFHKGTLPVGTKPAAEGELVNELAVRVGRFRIVDQDVSARDQGSSCCIFNSVSEEKDSSSCLPARYTK